MLSAGNRPKNWRHGNERGVEIFYLFEKGVPPGILAEYVRVTRTSFHRLEASIDQDAAKYEALKGKIKASERAGAGYARSLATESLRGMGSQATPELVRDQP